MSGNQFIPNINPSNHAEEVVSKPANDPLGKNLTSASQYLVLILFGLVPVFFTPGLWSTLGFDKVMLVVVVAALVIAFSCFIALRKTTVKTVLPLSLGLFWLMIISAFVSGFSSGDTLDAIRGSAFEVQTAGFLGVLGLAMTIPLFFQDSKIMSLKAISLFTLASLILLIYTTLRIMLGAEFLSFDSFRALTVSPIGNLNDLAILSGLVVVFSLITMTLLPLRFWLQATLAFLVFLAILMLAIVNIKFIWVVVGFFSLLMLLYLFTRENLFKGQETSSDPASKLLLVATGLVFVASATFVVAGDYIGSKVTTATGVQFAEVVPSIEGTFGIARGVYEESPILGIGPNRFADAWRLHKDERINQTVFWDTDFNSGSGFVSTLFINLGLLGGILLVAFHLFFLYFGYRVLVRSRGGDPNWTYITAVSFAVATFVWGMTYAYEPGATILIIGALFTGLTFAAGAALKPELVKSVPLVVNRRRGFFMMAVVIIIVSNIIGVLIGVSKQYVAEGSFSKAQVNSETVEEFELVANNAYELYPDDRFSSIQARLKLNNLNALLSIPQPTEDDQQEFLTLVQEAQNYIEQALSQDNTNPDNHAILAGVYSGLAVAGVDGAEERALAALNEAKNLDPTNPGYGLLAAQMSIRTGNLDLAKEELQRSLELKPNFTEALFLLAQIDISEGNTESAINTTRSIISLEPRNPTRYFQLGVLESSEGNYSSAISAFQSAIRLDDQYANARYLLALTYVATEEIELALDQLYIVRNTNQDNPQLQALIDQLEAGDIPTVPDLGFETPVSEISPLENDVDSETGRLSEETNLISPVNTIPEAEAEIEEEIVEAEASEESEETTEADTNETNEADAQ